MPFTPPPAGTTPMIYLHFEDSKSCKDWALKIEPVTAGGSTWKLVGEFGPSTRVAAGAKPAMKAKLAQTREYLTSGADYDTAVNDFIRRVKDELKSGYTVVEQNLTAEIEDALGIGTGASTTRAAKNPLMAKLAELLGPTNPTKMPVLLDGPPGTGKTYTARQFGKTAGFHFTAEVAGNPALESIDFLGGMIPVGGGKMIWMDGPVTRAFREAAKGRKGVLLVDEYLRIPRRERGIFLNALIPHDGHYLLRTGRPVGVNETEGTAMMELLAAPVANLSIVATTNSGTNYPDVEADDPAARERWHILHVRQDETVLKAILTEKVTGRGWPASIVEDYITLQKAIKKAFDDNFAEKELSPRLTLRVVDLTASPSRQAIAKAAKEMIPALTARTPDGDVVQEQSEFIEKAIKTALKV